MCYCPSYAYYDNNLKKIQFVSYDYFLNNKNCIKIPCGKCRECLNVKRLNLIRNIELFYSAYHSKSNMFFLTLTLKEIKNVDPSRIISLFFKRLKKHLKLNQTDCRYFWVFELGGETLREHYHALISVPLLISKNYFYKTINDCWKLGIVKIKEIYSNGISFYLSKYLSKQNNAQFAKSRFSQGLLKDLYSKCVKVDSSTIMINGNLTKLPIYYRGRGNPPPDFTQIRQNQDQINTSTKLLLGIKDSL